VQQLDPAGPHGARARRDARSARDLLHIRGAPRGGTD